MRIRKVVQVGLPVLGVAVVLAGVLFIYDNLYLQIVVVLLGLVLVESGIWNLASPILPSDRRYLALRREVDEFIGLVRRLNRTSLEVLVEPTPEVSATLMQIRDEMMASVHRMEEYAGKSDEELAEASAPRTRGTTV